jgi:uncharacterized protein (DUF58 family)
MRALRTVLRSLFVEHRALTISVILLLTSVGVALGSGFWLVARLANVMLIAIPIAYVWGRVNLRWLDVSAERPFDRLQEGNHFEERIAVTNRSWFTKLWLEIEDLSDLPGYSARRVISIGPRSQRTWRVVSESTRRGLYSMGPVRVSTTDLFGLFRHSRTFGAPQSVLVYPRGVDLPNFHAPPANLPGEGRYRRPTHTITPNAASIREYLPGDSLNRIHWRSSARTGDLMVKLFELDPASDVWVVLDLHGDVQAGEGDDGTEEHAVRIAASIARYFLLANRTVGFLAYGRRLHVEEPERGLAQYTRILEHLALARAEGDVSLRELLNHEGRRFGRHTTVIVVTPSQDESWVVSLQMLSGRGVKLASVLLEARTFGGEGNALLVYSALAAAGVLTYLIKRQDDIPKALAVSAEGAPAGGGGG